MQEVSLPGSGVVTHVFVCRAREYGEALVLRMELGDSEVGNFSCMVEGPDEVFDVFVRIE